MPLRSTRRQADESTGSSQGFVDQVTEQFDEDRGVMHKKILQGCWSELL